MDQMYEYLLEFGSMGMFAAFLVWQHLNMQKRFDALVERFQDQLSSLRTEYKEDTDELRDRYDKVIGTYNDERTAIRMNLSEKIAKVEDKVEGVNTSVQTLPFDALQIQIEAVSMAQRNSHLILEKGMEVVQEMREQAKIKAMARKFQGERES